MNSKALKLIMPLMVALFGITLFSCSSDGINIDYHQSLQRCLQTM